MQFDTESRDLRRQRLLARLPQRYNPWLHLAFPSLVGLGLIALCARSLQNVARWELFAVPLFFILANAVEWRVHRYVLHRRFRPLKVLYDRHIEHHRVYITEDMAIRDVREFCLVLLPAYAILTILVGNFPILLLFYLLGLPNLVYLYTITVMAYVVSYEWLHLAYHLPVEHPIGRMALIQKLRRHHAVHHDPSLMQRWNFNVTLPLWDWVRGTIYRGQGRSSV